jgi:uncharacterized protein YjbI with pentapeptide repeats
MRRSYRRVMRERARLPRVTPVTPTTALTRVTLTRAALTRAALTRAALTRVTLTRAAPGLPRPASLPSGYEPPRH